MIKPGLILFVAICCWSPAAAGQETTSDATQFPRGSVVGVFTFAAGKSIITDDLNTMNPSTHGGGVVINETGRILTVRHLLENISSSKWKVWARSSLHPDGRLFDASLVVADAWCDLAILKIELDDGDSLTAAKLTDENVSRPVTVISDLEHLIDGMTTTVELKPHSSAASPIGNAYQFGGIDTNRS